MTNKDVAEPGQMIHTGNPRSKETKEEKSWVQPRLNSKSQASMSCIVRPCLKNKGKVTEIIMEPVNKAFTKINKKT